jgi:hypothetical protein
MSETNKSKNQTDETFDFKEFFTTEEYDSVADLAHKTLEGLSRSQSVLSKNMLINKIKDKLEEELIEKPHFDKMLALIVSNLHISELSQGNHGLITHKRLAHAEAAIIAYVEYEDPKYFINRDLVQAAIDQKKGISEEQSTAVWESACTNRRVSVIEGTAGAGKSFTMAAMKEAYIASGYEVTGAALSWTAAKVLEESTGLKGCKAIEGLLNEIDKAKKQKIDYFRKPTVLIIDEAGLVGTMHMYRLLKETFEANVPVKVILTGDSMQLNPVDAGNALEAIVNQCGSSRIDTIRRQKQESHRIAVKDFCFGRSGQGLYTFLYQEAIKFHPNKKEILFNVVQDFLSYKIAFPQKKALILALSNKDVVTLNNMVRQAYKKLGKVSTDETMFTVTDGRQSWQAGFAVGDSVVFRKNDKNKPIFELVDGKLEPKAEGLFNRMTGTIVNISKADRGYDIMVELSNKGQFVTINTNEYKTPTDGFIPINHNFATTIYASQGQTVEQVFMIDSAMMQRRLAYVGMSRHTESCIIYADENELTQRLDKLLGIKPTDEEREQKRYGRMEMLQTMSFVWGKEAKNQTAMIAMKEREEKKKQERNQHQEEEINNDLLIAPNPTSNISDFDPAFNLNFPIIDLNYILNSEKPIISFKEFYKKPSFLGQDDSINAPRQEQIITSAKKNPVVSKVAQKGGNPTNPKGSLFLSLLKAHSVEEEEVNILASDVNIKNTQQNKPAEEKKVEAPKVETPVIDKLTLQIQSKVKYIKDEVGITIDGEAFKFTDTKIQPSDNFILEQKNKLWVPSRYGMPNIVVKDKNDNIISKYNLNGNDVLLKNQPAIHINKDGNENTLVYILKDVKEWLYTIDYAYNKYENKEKRPHIIWATPDINWKPILKSLSTKKVIINGLVKDDAYFEWANDLKQHLLTLGLHVKIQGGTMADANQIQDDNTTSNQKKMKM